MKRITLILAILLFASGLAHGQAGYLDKTFGDGGVVTVKLDSRERITPDDIQILSNGKILHVGSVASYPYNKEYLYMMRHHVDGRIDSSFGVHGRIVNNFQYAGVTKLY